MKDLFVVFKVHATDDDGGSAGVVFYHILTHSNTDSEDLFTVDNKGRIRVEGDLRKEYVRFSI